MVEDELATEVVLDDGRLTGRGRTTVLRLTWSPAEPLAVRLTLTSQPDHPALPSGQWVVLRDFVRYGLEEPTGDGHVRIRPDEQLDRVWFELARPGRAACVSVPRPTVRDFLDATDAAVPTGEERSAEAIDALLALLLED
ncbi:MAG: SsgA family sporulation/cell division regulator [Actinobacteria bacterium]|nr:SsgA family sporulation/cell division regulator [Actinomycetota bacterium]MCA1720508.1 SsgA family sporulation/cell division regulator [Actinomycetota bacterium]